jgi:hypothetical protein
VLRPLVNEIPAQMRKTKDPWTITFGQERATTGHNVLFRPAACEARGFGSVAAAHPRRIPQLPLPHLLILSAGECRLNSYNLLTSMIISHPSAILSHLPRIFSNVLRSASVCAWAARLSHSWARARASLISRCITIDLAKGHHLKESFQTVCTKAYGQITVTIPEQTWDPRDPPRSLQLAAAESKMISRRRPSERARHRGEDRAAPSPKAIRDELMTKANDHPTIEEYEREQLDRAKSSPIDSTSTLKVLSISCHQLSFSI